MSSPANSREEQQQSKFEQFSSSEGSEQSADEIYATTTNTTNSPIVQYPYPLIKYREYSSDENLLAQGTNSNSSESSPLLSNSESYTSDSEESETAPGSSKFSSSRRRKFIHRRRRGSVGSGTATAARKRKTISSASSKKLNNKSTSTAQRRKTRSPTPPLHYKNYFTHFKRRADYGKFSLLRVILYWSNKMGRFVSKYHKELCLGFFIIASALANLKSGSIKTKSVSSPLPFFENDDRVNLIEDRFKGEYIDLARTKIPYIPSFIFYYAPWDSESVEAREEFVKVAKHFSLTNPGLVKFYGINCWWPEGQCRKNFMTLSHYPILVAHVGGPAGIIYSGPMRASIMISFLNSVLKPFTRIDNESELWRFRAQHDSIVLASLNFSEPGIDSIYDTYRQMALRNLETDPLSQVAFAFFVKKDLGEKFFLTSSTGISLVLFNEIHTAKWVENYQEKGLKGPVAQVSDWIHERTTNPPITWLYRVRSGFANRPVSVGPIDLSRQLLSSPILLLITRRYYPSAYSPYYAQFKELALDYFNCNKSGNVTRLRRLTHKINSEWLKLWKSLYELCQGSSDYSCQSLWEQLQHWNSRKKLFIQETLKSFERVSKQLNFTGFSCRSARPFRFLAIDPTDIPYFTKLAFGLHVDTGIGNSSSFDSEVPNVTDPVAFILDAKNELVLPVKKFNISEIAITISNFTLKMEENDINSIASHSHFLNEKKKSLSNTSHNVIKTFNSEDLIRYLSENRTKGSPPLFLMFTAQFCGFCGIALAQFVRFGEFLKNSGITNITLGKLNTYTNSLPSKLSPDKIPTFVYFPTNRVSDGLAFPIGEDINSKSLLKFLLSVIEPEQRVKLAKQFATLQNDDLRISKRLVESKISNILNTLSQDSDTTLQHDEPDNEYYHVEHEETELDIDLTPKAINRWKYELLDHLRSLKLNLDV